MTDTRTRTGQDAGPSTDQDEARMREALGLTSPRPSRENRPKPAAFANSTRGGADVQKRRFVRDGEVQVTMVSGTRQGEPAQQRRSHAPTAANERIEATQAALRAERAAREKAERQVRELQAQVTDLTTKLGHVALARDEAVEAARRTDASRIALAQELETVKARLSAEVFARAQAERAVERAAERAAERLAPLEAAPAPAAAAPAAPAPAASTQAPPTQATPAAEAPKRGRGRPRKPAPEPAAEQRPVVAKRKPGRPRVEKEPEPIKWWLPKRAARKG